MWYVLLFFFGFLLGGGIVVTMMLQKHLEVRRQKEQQDLKERQLRNDLQNVKDKTTYLDEQVVSYQEMQDENITLKRDLQNIDVNVRKLEMDYEGQQELQNQLDERAKELGVAI